MAQELPVRLRVLVPAVDVDISGDDEFRPGCVLVARNGMKSEVGNTGAGGMRGTIVAAVVVMIAVVAVAERGRSRGGGHG